MPRRHGPACHLAAHGSLEHHASLNPTALPMTFLSIRYLHIHRAHSAPDGPSSGMPGAGAPRHAGYFMKSSPPGAGLEKDSGYLAALWRIHASTIFAPALPTRRDRPRHPACRALARHAMPCHAGNFTKSARTLRGSKKIVDIYLHHRVGRYPLSSSWPSRRGPIAPSSGMSDAGTPRHAGNFMK